MGDNPFSPEGNPFLQGGAGGPDGAGPTADSDGGLTQGPPAVPETTKPRQMPGGAAPQGMPVPVGAPMGGGLPGGSGPTGAPPAPMPFTQPAPTGQAPSMQTPKTSFRRAVALRDEILATNQYLTDAQAFYLARQVLALQTTARTQYDPEDYNDPNNPASPKHPFYRHNQNNQVQWNPQGPTMGPQSGYGHADPSWAQRARQIGYSGENPALVGGAVTLVDKMWKKWKSRGAGGEGEGTEPQPEQGAVTTPVDGAEHTQPGGPPTPHLHPEAPQPGEPSVPARRQQQRRPSQKAQEAQYEQPQPKAHDLNDFDRARHAALVYGEA